MIKKPKGRFHGQIKRYKSSSPSRVKYQQAQHHFEKYSQLAKDALTSGDRVSAEGFFQHADHYLRIMNENRDTKFYNSSEGNSQEGQSEPLNDSDNSDTLPNVISITPCDSLEESIQKELEDSSD